MAGPLAPTINPDIGYERPVVEERGAMLGLVGSLIGSLRKPGSAGSGEASVAEANRRRKLELSQRWTEGVEVVAAVREQKGEQAAALYERTLARNYTMAGGAMDADAKSAYQAITGRDSDLFGRTTTDVALDDTMQTPEFQQLFLAAAAAPGVDPKDEDAKAAWALQRIAQRQHDKLLIEDTQSDWNRSKESAYLNEIEVFEQTLVGGMLLGEQSGVPITNQSVLEAKVLWEQQKSRLVQPSNIDDAQYQAVRQKIESLDRMFETFDKIADREYILEDFWNKAALAAKESGDVESVILSFAYKANTPEMLSMLGTSPMEYIKKVQEASKLTFENPATLFGGGGLPTKALSGDASALPDPIRRELSKLSPEELFKVATSAAYIGDGSHNLADPASRQDFVDNYVKAGFATAGIEGRIGAKDLEAMYGKNFLTKYQQLQASDPEAAYRVQQAVLAGSRAELRRQRTFLDSVESGSPLVFWDDRWDRYSWDPEAVREQVGSELFSELSYQLNQHYGGDVHAAMEDRGSKLVSVDAKTAFNAVAGGMAEYLPKALEARAALNTLEGVENALGKPTEQQLAREVKIGNYVIPPALREQPEFLNEVDAIAGRLGADPSHLLMAMHFETGGTFRPDIPNAAGSSGVGLIQFMASTAASLGTTTKDLADMSAVEQLHYVEKYLTPYKGKLNNFGDVYMAILYPAAIGKSDEYPLFKEGTKAYDGNRGLDRDGDGIVTRGEAITHAAKQAMGKANVGNLTQGKVTPKRLGISDADGIDQPKLTADEASPSDIRFEVRNETTSAPVMSTPTMDGLPDVDRSTPKLDRLPADIKTSAEVEALLHELTRDDGSSSLYNNVRTLFKDIRSGVHGDQSIVYLGRVPHEVRVDDTGAVGVYNIYTGQRIREGDHEIWTDDDNRPN